ncbi:hypothetical protein ACVFZB_24430, partial [Escherichia coli]
MNAKDYANEAQARADLVLQEQAQVLLEKTRQTDKDAHIKDVNGKPVVVDGKQQAVLPSDQDPLAQALKDGKTALDRAKQEAQAEPDPKLREALKHALDALKSPTKREVAEAQAHVREQFAHEANATARAQLDQAFEEAIKKAQAASDTGLVEALKASREGHTYKTAAELNAALSSYEKSRQAVDAAQREVEAGMRDGKQLDTDVSNVPGLDARLMRAVSGADAAQQLAKIKSVLAEQKKVQTLINAEKQEAIRARMNGKDYASEQEARADLALQQAAQALLDKQREKDPGAKIVEIGKKPVVLDGQGKPADGKDASAVEAAQKEADKALDEAIGKADKAGQKDLAAALRADKAARVYHTKAQVEESLASLSAANDLHASVEPLWTDVQALDAALKKDEALNARMNRFARGKDFAQVKAGLDEQTKVQGVING